MGAITTPSTDSLGSLQLAFPSNTTEKIPGLNLSLYNILPTPNENVQVIDILKFKIRRKDELLNFRQNLYDHQDKLKQASEPGEVRDLNARFAEKIQVEVSKLGKAFTGDRIPYILGTVKNIFVSESPAINAYFAGATDSIKLTAAIGGIAFAGLFSLGEYILDAKNRQSERLANNTFSYLYLAQQEGIIDHQ